MAAGLRIVGSSGVLQIDETYSNISFKQKITLSLPSGVSQPTFSFVGTINAIVAYRPSAGAWIGVMKSGWDGTTWTYTLAAPTSGTVDIYIFDVGISAPTDNFGLIIRNANNQITFHSGTHPLSIIAFDPSRTCAVIQTRVGLTTSPGAPNGASFILIQCLGVGDSGITTQNANLNISGPNVNVAVTGTWLVCDVSGL